MADVRIGVDVDTRQAASEIRRGIYQPLDDVNDALKDVEKSSDGMADAIDDASRKASRSLKRIDDDGTRPAGEGIRAFKDEAVQNFSEVASSFDGSLQGAVDGVQGTLGGLATAISGPVGLALGGLGLIAGTVATQWATSAEEIKANWSEMYTDMIDSGKTFLSDDLINQRIQATFEDQEKLNGIIDEGAAIGTNYLNIVRAQAGDMDALRLVIDDAKTALDDQNRAQDDFIQKNGDESAAIADKQGQLELLIDKYTRMITQQDSAARAASDARTAMDLQTDANNRNADSVDKVTEAVNRLPADREVRLRVLADMTDVEAQIATLSDRNITLRLRGEGMSDGRFPP